MSKFVGHAADDEVADVLQERRLGTGDVFDERVDAAGAVLVYVLKRGVHGECRRIDEVESNLCRQFIVFVGLDFGFIVVDLQRPEEMTARERFPSCAHER